MLPLIRKYPDKYLDKVFEFGNSQNLDLQSAALNLLIKLIKKREDLIPQVVNYFIHQWLYPLGEAIAVHIAMLKTVAKIDPEYYVNIWREYGSSRDPQIV